MSAALNPKRLFSVPERPLSADPASTTASSIRPSFSSFSTFSSSISSVFGGRHSRSSSTATSAHALGAPPLARPASAAPTQQPAKWVPRPTTPGTASQSRSSRHRATSSASAAAAVLSSSAETPLPPLPGQPEPYRRSSPAPTGGVVDSGTQEPWKMEIQRNLYGKYMHRVRGVQRDYASRLRSARGSAMTASARRRDSSSSGSIASSTDGSVDEGSMPEDLRSRLSQEHEQMLSRVKREYEEELRAAIRDEARRRGVPSHPFPSPQNFTPFDRQKEHERDQDVIVEDELADEWTWRPEEGRPRPSDGERDRGTDKDKWKEMVRQEQQVIWDTIKRGTTPANASQQQQQPLSSSAGRKVHFAPSTPPSSDVSPSSAAPISATQTQPPSLPRTPHTPIGTGYPSRPISAYQAMSNSTSGATRPLSPAVTAPGVRSNSARPASPAYTRWLPSTGPTPSTATVTSGQAQGSARTGSNPIAIPGRGTGVQVLTDGNGSAGSAGKDRPGRNNTSGSWRDWPTTSLGHGHGGGTRRDAPTPSPTAGSGASHVHAHQYPRTASNSNLQSSMYVTAQMHSRTPSSGNLHAHTYSANVHPSSHLGHARVPSNSNLQSNAGAGIRRAMTPGPMSSASGYARQRTGSMSMGAGPGSQRAPSVPPIPPNAPREREKVRERRRKGVVDDREPDESAAAVNTQDVQRVRATAGLGSRTSSNRSALVDDDVPVPEVFSHVPAPAIHTSSSQRSQRSNARRSQVDDEDEEIIPRPRRDKGKGKARAPPSPLLSTTPLPGSGWRKGAGVGGMYAAQLEDFASLLRKDLGISAEA